MAASGTGPQPKRDYDLEERVERIETLLSCMAIHGDNCPSFDRGPKVAREIIEEIRRDLQETSDGE